MNIGDIDGLIKDLDSSMYSLTRIRTSSQSLLDVGTFDQRSNRRLCDFLRSVRLAARTLHSALETAFPSACHEQHVIRLYLDSRGSSYKSRKPIAFNVSFGGSRAGHETVLSRKIFSIHRLLIMNTVRSLRPALAL